MQNHSQARQGALIAVSASAEDQEASDKDSYTPQVVDLLRGAPDQSLLGALRQTSTRVLQGGIEHGQRPRIAMRPRRGRLDGHGRRWAMYIANQEYAQNRKSLINLSSLRNVNSQTVDLKKELDTRGFRTISGDIQRNKTEMQIERLIRAAANNQSLQETDCLLVFYSGHGMPAGIPGYDYNNNPADIVSYKTLLSATKAAQTRGIDVIIMLDSCYSGMLVTEAQMEQVTYLMDSAQNKNKTLIQLIDLMHLSIRRLDTLVQSLGGGLIIAKHRNMTGGFDAQTEREAMHGEMQSKMRKILYGISDNLNEITKILLAAFPDTLPPASVSAARNQIIYTSTQGRISSSFFSKKTKNNHASLRDLLSDVVSDVLYKIESQMASCE